MDLSEHLRRQPPGKQLALLSFFITNSPAVEKLEKEWSIRNNSHNKILGRDSNSSKISHDEFGGKIALVDPFQLEKGFLYEMEIPLAFGLLFEKKRESLFVTSGTEIRQIKNGACINKISNPLFNDLHSITLSYNENLIIASTGVDGILEISPDNNSEKAVWDWLATEQGFAETKDKQQKKVHRWKDYRDVVTSTPEHTTHVNTALNYRSGRILATLFHQGKLIEIDRASKEHKVILSGLKSPHNIRQREKGFMLSDTRANRILLLNNVLEIEEEIWGNFNWVQDAVEMWHQGEKYHLVADSNNERVVLLNSYHQTLSNLNWGKKQRKISSIELITAGEALSVLDI